MELKYYETQEIAKVLKVTTRTVTNYIKSGNLKAVKIGGKWLVAEKDLNEFLEKGM